jgi:lysophospholipase L1-like esterase
LTRASGGSRRLKRALLCIGSPLVLLGLIEIGLRIAGYSFDPWAEYAGGQTHDELTQARIYARDPDLLWTLRPNASIHVPEAGFTNIKTNSRGLRGPELPRAKEPGEFRVLCLGDSVTFGLGLSDQETWPARLAIALGKAPQLAGRRVRVVSGAVPGWSSVQGMRLLSQLKELDPDVIVFWFGLNDAKDARGIPDSERKIPSETATAAVGFLRNFRLFQLLQDAASDRAPTPSDARRVSRDEFREAARDLIENARSGGPRPIFVRYPERTARTIAELETVVGWAETLGAKFVVGPHRLLSPVVPAIEGADLLGKSARTEQGPAVVFEERRADSTRPLAEVKADLAMLQALKKSLDLRLAELPGESLGYEDLFGNAAPESILSDNCHLTARGARLAGEAVARVLLKENR